MTDSGHDGKNAVDEERGDAGPADGGKGGKALAALDPIPRSGVGKHRGVCGDAGATLQVDGGMPVDQDRSQLQQLEEQAGNLGREQPYA